MTTVLCTIKLSAIVTGFVIVKAFRFKGPFMFKNAVNQELLKLCKFVWIFVWIRDPWHHQHTDIIFMNDQWLTCYWLCPRVKESEIKENFVRFCCHILKYKTLLCIDRTLRCVYFTSQIFTPSLMLTVAMEKCLREHYWKTFPNFFFVDIQSQCYLLDFFFIFTNPYGLLIYLMLIRFSCHFPYHWPHVPY